MNGCFQKVFVAVPTKISALPEAHLGTAVNGAASINPSTVKQMKAVSSKICIKFAFTHCCENF